MVTTRFNSTCNGLLHIGHLYMALVNRDEARKSCGRFVLRLDDNQSSWRQRLGDAELHRYGLAQLVDLEPFDLRPDAVIWQSAREGAVQQFLARQPRFQPIFDHYPTIEHTPRWVGPPQGFAPFPLMTYITAERVVLDHEIGVTLLIRGQELIPETSLYAYFCLLFGFPVPEFVYLPRLCCRDGAELADVSKTAGNWKLSDLRQRWTAQEIVNMLARSCLKEPDQPWLIANVLPEPRLTDDFYRAG